MVTYCNFQLCPYNLSSVVHNATAFQDIFLVYFVNIYKQKLKTLNKMVTVVFQNYFHKNGK